MSRFHQFKFNLRAIVRDCARQQWRKVSFHSRGLVRSLISKRLAESLNLS